MSAVAEQLRIAVVRPALKALDPIIPYSVVAENLVLGTAAHESDGFTCRVQIGGGPALGLWQIEPTTDMDEHRNFLKFRPQLETRIAALMRPDPLGEAHQLEVNDAYGAALCRLKYFRSPAKLPADPGDIFEMGRLWASVYNTRWPAQRWISSYRRWIEDMDAVQIAALEKAAAAPSNGAQT